MAVEVKNIKFKRKLLLLCLYINKLFGKTENNSVLIKKSGLFKQYGGGYWHSAWIPANPDIISIGENVIVAADVRLYEHDMVSWIFNRNPYYKGPFVKRYYGGITIGNNVMIGARSIIMYNVTKIFTCIVVLQLIKEQIIKIDSKIGQLDKRFKYLQDVTIKDLLSFRVPLRTDDRIENALSYEDAEYLILNIKPDYTQSRLYTDMGAIVLSYVVESVTGTDLYNLVRKYILDPCDMKDTVLVIRPEDMGRVVSNNYERRIANNNYCVIRDISKGMVNDGKARKLEKWCPRLYGHAGLFSTAADMGKFASMMLSGNLLDSQFVNKIGVNHTGKKNEDGTFSQFHGLLCYSKNPVAKNSEVNHWLSGNAFALGGYTGNQLTIDYRNQLYIFMASNRCHNRITSVSGMDIVYEAGMTLEWPDGKRYICNKGYAFDRDESVINPAIELAMKWRFLEWLLGSESKVIRC